MKRCLGWLFGSVVLTVLGAVDTAWAQPPLPGGWLKTQVNRHGQHCEQHEVRSTQDEILVACGAAGVWSIIWAEGSPMVVHTYDFPGEVVGFLKASDGSTWVKLKMLEARPIESGKEATATAPLTSPAPPVPSEPPPPSAPPQRDASFPEPEQPPLAAPPPAPPEPASAPPPRPKTARRQPATAKVVKRVPGAVIISVGSEEGIERSQRIELSLDASEPSIDGEVFMDREIVAIGIVTNTTDHTAMVRLGVNEDVPIGAHALVTSSPVTASLAGPPRISDVWQLSAMARPFAALSELGGGALLGFEVGRRTKHLHVSASLEPLAFAIVSDKQSVGAANGVISLAYDSQYFEMGLGLGAQTVNDPDFGSPPGSGLTLAQLIRIGALDGTSFTARTSVALFQSELMFGGMIAEARFHVTRGYWLQLGGGGGAVGYGYGEIGLRALLNGNGLAGSTYLTVTAGGAGVFKATRCEPFEFCFGTVSYGGPMAGVGGEWRF